MNKIFIATDVLSVAIIWFLLRIIRCSAVDSRSARTQSRALLSMDMETPLFCSIILSFLCNRGCGDARLGTHWDSILTLFSRLLAAKVRNSARIGFGEAKRNETSYNNDGSSRNPGERKVRQAPMEANIPETSKILNTSQLNS